MSILSDKAIVGKMSSEEASKLLRERGIIALQNQAAYLPAITENPLPETEQSFSERTRSSRMTRYMRLTRWLNWLWVNVWKLNTLVEQIPPISAYSQVAFITDKKYLEWEDDIRWADMDISKKEDLA